MSDDEIVAIGGIQRDLADTLVEVAEGKSLLTDFGVGRGWRVGVVLFGA